MLMEAVLLFVVTMMYLYVLPCGVNSSWGEISIRKRAEEEGI